VLQLVNIRSAWDPTIVIVHCRIGGQQS